MAHVVGRVGLEQMGIPGGILTSDPDCVSWGPNRIDCVVKGPDNGVVEMVQWKWHIGNME